MYPTEQLYPVTKQLYAPVLDDDGNEVKVPEIGPDGKTTGGMVPRMEPVTLVEDEINNKLIGHLFVFPDGHEREGQVFERKAVRDSANPGGYRTEILPGGKAGKVLWLYGDLYVKPGGHLFTFPVEPDPENQTLSRSSKIGNMPERDLYVEKKYRMATVKDVLDARKRAVINSRDQKRRKEFADPLKRDERQAQLMADAIKLAIDTQGKRPPPMAKNRELAKQIEAEALSKLKGDTNE